MSAPRAKRAASADLITDTPPSKKLRTATYVAETDSLIADAGSPSATSKRSASADPVMGTPPSKRRRTGTYVIGTEAAGTNGDPSSSPPNAAAPIVVNSTALAHQTSVRGESGSGQEDAGPATKPSEKKSQAAPIKTLFIPQAASSESAAKYDEAWGRKPMPGSEGPRSHPDQPPAHSSNAQTNPPLWEDRKYRFQKGNRFVRSFRKGEATPEGAPLLDQQDNLVLRLIDMRPKSRKDSAPRRMPFIYVYENGLPKDWDNKQTIKALNDRRQQAIDRITVDAPWTAYEREYLASLLREFPDASILELTERYNWRFMDQDFAKTTAFSWDDLSTGRTIESVRYEYLFFKESYVQGMAPTKKQLAEKHVGKNAGKDSMVAIFGPKDQSLDHVDDSDGDSENEDKVSSRKKRVQPKKATSKPHQAGTVHSADGDSLDGGTPDPVEQPELTHDEAELLELAGYNNSGETRSDSSGLEALSEDDDQEEEL